MNRWQSNNRIKDLYAFIEVQHTWVLLSLGSYRCRCSMQSLLNLLSSYTHIEWFFHRCEYSETYVMLVNLFMHCKTLLSMLGRWSWGRKLDGNFFQFVNQLDFCGCDEDMCLKLFVVHISIDSPPSPSYCFIVLDKKVFAAFKSLQELFAMWKFSWKFSSPIFSLENIGKERKQFRNMNRRI